jgi:hypothetical protein
MTEKAAIWARRVAEWKSSGLTSEAYCAGRNFTAGGLRHWSHRLGKTVARDAERPSVRLARVVRRRTGTSSAARGAPVEAKADGRLVVEVGEARVVVARGFDAVMLGAVLDVLGRRGGEK